MPHPVLVRHRPVPSLLYKIVRRAGGTILVLLAVYFVILIIFSLINPNGPDPVKQKESELWIATSHSWLDRLSCRWIGICGGSNWLTSTWLFRRRRTAQPPRSTHKHRHEWIDRSVNPDKWSDEEWEARDIPQYVLDHAPFLYLHENERWWPTDVADFLHHVEHRNEGWKERANVSLSTMVRVLPWENVPGNNFLQSRDDPESLPDWIMSEQNKPVKKHKQTQKHGKLRSATQPTGYRGSKPKRYRDRVKTSLRSDYIQSPSKDQKVLRGHHEEAVPADEFSQGDERNSPGARSPAPAYLITVNKGNNTVDAFWFFFYAFNRGARVAGIQFGNHVGDWEHIMVRFQDEKPTEVFLSAHEWGSAYRFDVMEKAGDGDKRPVGYAGLGSHAHYATPGKHAYAIPFGLLSDSCSRGYLWDPTLNLLSFVYRPDAKGWPEEPKFKASARNPRAHSSFLEYKGKWGDKKYTLGDPLGRNYRFAGENAYLNGPTGPWDKALDRTGVCEHANKPCEIRDRTDGYVGPLKGSSTAEVLDVLDE